MALAVDAAQSHHLPSFLERFAGRAARMLDAKWGGVAVFRGRETDFHESAESPGPVGDDWRAWIVAQSREHAFLGKPIQPAAAKPLAPFAKPAPLMASDYAGVAQMNLFAQDRNSNVVLDPPAPVVVKPVPPFPVARGVMLWEGMPPTVVLNDRGVQKGFHPGDAIGVGGGETGFGRRLVRGRDRELRVAVDAARLPRVQIALRVEVRR